MNVESAAFIRYDLYAIDRLRCFWCLPLMSH